MSNIIYPIPSTKNDKSIEMDVYARFMRHLRLISYNRDEIKVLMSIQFVSDMTASSEAHVAKVLVDLGLRAPRVAFPAEYLDYIDAAMVRADSEFGSPSQPMKELVNHWSSIGEDKFVSYKRQYSLLDENIYSGVNH